MVVENKRTIGCGRTQSAISRDLQTSGTQSRCLRLVVRALRLGPDRRGQELVGERLVREESSNLVNVASVAGATEGVDSFELGFSSLCIARQPHRFCFSYFIYN